MKIESDIPKWNRYQIRFESETPFSYLGPDVVVMGLCLEHAISRAVTQYFLNKGLPMPARVREVWNV